MDEREELLKRAERHIFDISTDIAVRIAGVNELLLKVIIYPDDIVTHIL